MFRSRGQNHNDGEDRMVNYDARAVSNLYTHASPSWHDSAAGRHRVHRLMNSDYNSADSASLGLRRIPDILVKKAAPTTNRKAYCAMDMAKHRWYGCIDRDSNNPPTPHSANTLRSACLPTPIITEKPTSSTCGGCLEIARPHAGRHRPAQTKGEANMKGEADMNGARDAPQLSS